jgi:predicted transcriptional regulator
MSTRLNVILSNDLNREIDRIAEETETNKSEILRKSLQLFIAAQAGTKRGLKLGLIDKETNTVQTEIIGL